MSNAIKRIYHAARRVFAYAWLNGVHRHITQIGITGSYGKTSTSHAVYHALACFAPTLVTDTNLDTIYNIPITALKLRKHWFAVFEMGIDTPGEMGFHLQIVKPHIGIITGITPVHADEVHLGSLENIIFEKRKLIEALPKDGFAILNADDPHVREMAPYTQAKVLLYGGSEDADYRAEQIRVTADGIQFQAVTPQGTFPVTSPQLGAHSAYNLMAAIAVGISLAIPVEMMQAAFSDLQPLHGRLSIEAGPKGITLINDALRANPATTKAGLEFLHALDLPGEKIAVLGEMGELGSVEVEMHRQIGRIAAQNPPDILVCVGELTRHTANAALEAGLPAARVFPVRTVHQAAEILMPHIHPGTVLYLKGSLLRHMERILLLLEGREVGCAVISCPLYHQCNQCQYLKSGYPGESSHK